MLTESALLVSQTEQFGRFQRNHLCIAGIFSGESPYRLGFTVMEEKLDGILG
jgi:hypothetical protein